MRISNAFPSKYLKAGDLQDRQVTVLMSHVDMESVADGEPPKPVLYFEGKQKGLVLNKTNSKTISHAHGDDTEEWRGKQLILFPAMVDFRGDQVEAIRVRVPKLQPSQRPIQQSEVAPAPAPAHDPPPPSSAADYGAEMDDEIPF